MSEQELMPAITVLERRLGETERKVNELLGALNILREEAGLPPRPPSRGDGDDASAPTQIKSDSFFGKRQQTAIREYLKMRRAQGLGPARPREIYDALVTGGFEYEAKDAETALVGMRALLRKRSKVFIKVGTGGAYGLVSWYPEARRPKDSVTSRSNDSGDDNDDSDDNELETVAGVEGDSSAA